LVGCRRRRKKYENEDVHYIILACARQATHHPAQVITFVSL
jgi:hypothetical protein